jgi:hypothetical protein
MSERERGGEQMIKEVELKYTTSNLVSLVKNRYSENSTEYLASLLSTVVTENQMRVLIDFLEVERTSE